MQIDKPELAVEQANAIPLTGRSRRAQDQLAAFAIEALQQWRTMQNQIEEEDPLEELQAEVQQVEAGPPEDMQAEDRQQQEARQEEEDWEELQAGVFFSRSLQKLRCQSCLTTTSMHRRVPFLRCHSNCLARPRRHAFGPAPLALPSYVSFVPANELSGPRILCETCGASSHFCHRARFLNDHRVCAGHLVAPASLGAED